MEYERKDFNFNDKVTSNSETKTNVGPENQSFSAGDILRETKNESSASQLKEKTPTHQYKPNSYLGELDPEPRPEITKKKPKRDIHKLKNYLILVLVAALFITWVGPSIDEKTNITGAITGLFVDDYSKTQGVDGGSYYKGNKNAKVTIIEFSDFECPYCSRVQPALKQIEDTYIKTGQVKLIFKHLPLSFHKNAEPAAIASQCAGQQGKFWEYHDKLFSNQRSLTALNLKSWASELKLDTTKFNACLRDRKTSQQIQADKAAATKANVRGTPGFLINGEVLSGAQPFSKFKEVIERKLK